MIVGFSARKSHYRMEVLTQSAGRKEEEAVVLRLIKRLFTSRPVGHGDRGGWRSTSGQTDGERECFPEPEEGSSHSRGSDMGEHGPRSGFWGCQ